MQIKGPDGDPARPSARTSMRNSGDSADNIHECSLPRFTASATNRVCDPRGNHRDISGDHYLYEVGATTLHEGTGAARYPLAHRLGRDRLADATLAQARLANLTSTFRACYRMRLPGLRRRHFRFAVVQSQTIKRSRAEAEKTPRSSSVMELRRSPSSSLTKNPRLPIK